MAAILSHIQCVNDQLTFGTGNGLVVVRQNAITRNVVDYYNDIIMGAIASQITSLAIVYSTVYSGWDQRKY